MMRARLSSRVRSFRLPRQFWRFALILLALEFVSTILIGFGPIQLAYVEAVNGYAALSSHISSPVAMWHRAHLAERMRDPRVVSAGNALGWKLLPKFAATNPEGNVFFSPYSISAAASMAYNGAGGQTKAEMERALGLGGLTLAEINAANARQVERLDNADPKVQISVANSLWADDRFPLAAGYAERLRDGYDAEVQNVDLQAPWASDRINAWARKNTGGEINKIVGPIQSTACVALVNAVCFHGEWSEAFERLDTTPQPFRLSDGTTKRVPMMSQRVECRYLLGGDFQAVRLPYGDGGISMYVFLPLTREEAARAARLPAARKAGVRPRPSRELTAWSRGLDARRWDLWMRGFRPAVGDLRLPRFRVESAPDVKGALVDAGMRLPLASGEADLRAMTADPQGRPYISGVSHRAMIDVDEAGTTAAAATATETTYGKNSETDDVHFNMQVDHPFFCAIRDDGSGAVLFVGLIYNPVSK